VIATRGAAPNIRLIPRLDIKGPNLVKGIHLEGLRVLGRPADFARTYYLEGADELLFVDIVASLYQRNQLLPIILETAKEMYIPLTVAGGLRSLQDIRSVLRAGADKAALNTAAIRQPELISEAALAFGSSTVVVSIEAKKRPDGSYEAYTDCGRERTGREVVAWAQEAESRGAGEILITSIDREGTGAGFDLELTELVTSAVSLPVVASGGAGRKEDVVALAKGSDFILAQQFRHRLRLCRSSSSHYVLCERVVPYRYLFLSSGCLALYGLCVLALMRSSRNCRVIRS
jgi:cyclase